MNYKSFLVETVEVYGTKSHVYADPEHMIQWKVWHHLSKNSNTFTNSLASQTYHPWVDYLHQNDARTTDWRMFHPLQSLVPALQNSNYHRMVHPVPRADTSQGQLYHVTSTKLYNMDSTIHNSNTCLHMSVPVPWIGNRVYNKRMVYTCHNNP